MCCVSGRVRCTNGQGQAPHMGANGTNMAFLIVFTLTGRRGEFPARGGGWRRWGDGTKKRRNGERQSVSIFTATITKSEERGDSSSLATALRAERSVLGLELAELDIRLSKGEWARQVSRQRAGGWGGCSAPTACMQARAGRNCILSSLLATSADTVEGAVSAKSRTTSADSPCSLRRSSHRAVRCSSALKRIRTLAWSRLWDEAVRNRCAEVVEIARLCARARRRPPEDEDGAFLWDGHQTSSVTSPRTR